VNQYARSRVSDPVQVLTDGNSAGVRIFPSRNTDSNDTTFVNEAGDFRGDSDRWSLDAEVAGEQLDGEDAIDHGGLC